MAVAMGFVLEEHEKDRMDEYVDLWKDDPWYPAIKDAHDLLKAYIPGYYPAQIKEKFFDLRFYYQLPPDATDIEHKLANAIVRDAERRCDVIDEIGKRGRYAPRQAL